MRAFITVWFLFLTSTGFTQTEGPATIRIKKESNLSKAVLDNTEHRLFVVDRFGNPRENEIVSYELTVKGKKGTRRFAGYSNALTREMIAYLNKQKSSTKIFFTGIVAKDDGDHPVNLPDVIEVWFPECKGCK